MMQSLRRSWNITRATLHEMAAFLSARQAERRHAKVGPLYLWREKRAFQIRFLIQMGLRPEHFLLDIGCGTLRGGIPLIEYLCESHYYGVDSRVAVLDEGRRELRDAGLEQKQPVLRQSADLASLDLGRQFDYIWAYSVLIHMYDRNLTDCLVLVQKHLKNDGGFYANVCIGEPKEALLKWQGFPVVSRPLVFYREIGARFGLDCADLGTVASLGDISGLKSLDEQHLLRFQKGEV